MESQIKISLKIPGPCRIPTDGPRGRGSVPPPWVSAGNIKSGAELSLNTALHFSMRTHGQTPILRLAMERKDGYNRPVVQSLDCCAEWYRHSYRAAGCASTLRPAAVYVSMPILPHCLWNFKGLFRPAEAAPAGRKLRRGRLAVSLFHCSGASGTAQGWRIWERSSYRNPQPQVCAWLGRLPSGYHTYSSSRPKDR